MIALCLAFGLGFVAYPLLRGSTLGAMVDRQMAGAEVSASGDQQDLSTFWEAWHLLERDFYGAKPTPQVRIYGAVHGMVQSYGDPYTLFVEPQPRELEADNLRGSFGGIGATIELTATSFVLHPLPDQPAERAGILDGDQLVRVDETVITPTMTVDQVVAHVRGPVDSTVRIGVLRKARQNGQTAVEELEFSIVRAKIETPSVEWRLLTEYAQGADVGYLRQTLFSERSPDEMRRGLRELTAQGATRFIWDLRGNPGGLVESAVQMADIWLDGGVIVIENRADGSSTTYEAQGGGEAVDAPLLVVVDGASASASEIVAGAMQDRLRAKVVGEKTFGKGSVQLVYELADHSSLHVTNAQWFTPNRRQITGQGLVPDKVVEPGVDPLQAALALFGGE